MTVFDILTELQEKAFHDEKIRQELLETRQAEEPLFAFCKKCQELGYELYPMELVNAGEEFYASMKRSTNGGGNEKEYKWRWRKLTETGRRRRSVRIIFCGN